MQLFASPIAELLCDPTAHLERLRDELDPEERLRTYVLGEAVLSSKIPPRDGRPLHAHVDASGLVRHVRSRSCNP